jgi:hypothetical protein
MIVPKGRMGRRDSTGCVVSGTTPKRITIPLLFMVKTCVWKRIERTGLVKLFC